MFQQFKPQAGRSTAVQLKEYIQQFIINGVLQAEQKLPSTRELSLLLNLSRNTVILAYQGLEEDGFVYVRRGNGSYVSAFSKPATISPRSIDWKRRVNNHARMADSLDIMKRGIRAEEGMIRFTSIAPDEKLFDVDHVKRAFLDRMAIEGSTLLNYGYAKGYKPLIDYLFHYMEKKGVNLKGKDMLITNGFTEGLDIVLSALKRDNGAVLCENPTHHTAIKQFRLQGYDVTGIPMERDGIHLQELERAVQAQSYDCAYVVPSYHNPTGIVMSPAKRLKLLQVMANYDIPIIEDGFNEELRYSGAHVSPLMAAAGRGNNVIYLGSFSKVLFPGLRVGWVLADQELIYYLESIKRARSIHTSTLDQSLLYQYLQNGNMEKYVKRARAVYRRKYEWTKQCCETYIPYAKLSGDGGLHLFIEFDAAFDTRVLLEACARQGVLFTPGDQFYTNGLGQHAMRIGFSRLTAEEISQGIRIIGDTAKHIMGL
ncbi:PLP-dependent aminotransferase family protein [Paenibacillus sp. UMB4589-SE434]|uniref:MocR-like pyridoxine biosynthesis transcription factor PdxR n=1 Tax=Paenibacillus sp. UMB4589-SE434 TaxID=3046314 RepID=UPI00254FF2AF|nr:PLP-dependent aminotransferase family protein [Paenibacillus sp. UMB4589-SE434]MDK8182395.1 PLP-dependent aminotransferase family protein [Paenibacillus sp. UMB4589-SE434]